MGWGEHNTRSAQIVEVQCVRSPHSTKKTTQTLQMDQIRVWSPNSCTIRPLPHPPRVTFNRHPDNIKKATSKKQVLHGGSMRWWHLHPTSWFCLNHWGHLACRHWCWIGSSPSTSCCQAIPFRQCKSLRIIHHVMDPKTKKNLASYIKLVNGRPRPKWTHIFRATHFLSQVPGCASERRERDGVMKGLIFTTSCLKQSNRGRQIPTIAIYLVSYYEDPTKSLYFYKAIAFASGRKASHSLMISCSMFIISFTYEMHVCVKSRIFSTSNLSNSCFTRRAIST